MATTWTLQPKLKDLRLKIGDGEFFLKIDSTYFLQISQRQRWTLATKT